MIKKVLLIASLCLTLFNITISPQDNLIINAFNRYSLTLNGEWHFIIDPYENGYYNYRWDPFDKMDNPSTDTFFLNTKPVEKWDRIEYDFDKSEKMKVPSDWNTQRKELFFYEGTIWYKTSFDYEPKNFNNKVFVYFGAVNYQADVYLNGKKLGTHLGGFTPFNYEITDHLKNKGNFLIVKVDNKRRKESVPTLNTDWWNYGGITRDVKIIEVPKNFISDYFIYLEKLEPKTIKSYLKVQGELTSKKEIIISIPELNFSKTLLTDQNGIAQFESEIKDLKLWSPDDPKLYEVIVSYDDEKFSDLIGFRKIITQDENILLNGKSIFLRGICIHEEKPFGGGRINSEADALQLLTWAKELGANFVRLAHYPHDENMVRLADKMGIMIWEEIPVYWTIDWNNIETYLNAQNQLNEVISRDKNRASVIIWSMANETPGSDARNNFLSKLINFTRNSDPTRLISAALEQSPYNNDNSVRTIHDEIASKVDILSFNQYLGWYEGLPEKCKTITWKIDNKKPVFVSEFGAGAKFGLRGDSLTRWTEDYQEYLYKETLNMLDKIPQLRGFSPWILMDFRSPRRQLPGVQDFWNRKGLFSEMGEKKVFRL